MSLQYIRQKKCEHNVNIVILSVIFRADNFSSGPTEKRKLLARRADRNLGDLVISDKTSKSGPLTALDLVNYSYVLKSLQGSRPSRKVIFSRKKSDEKHIYRWVKNMASQYIHKMQFH